MPNPVILLFKCDPLEPDTRLKRYLNFDSLCYYFHCSWSNHSLTVEKMLQMRILLTISPLAECPNGKEDLAVDVDSRDLCIDSISHTVQKVEALGFYEVLCRKGGLRGVFQEGVD